MKKHHLQNAKPKNKSPYNVTKKKYYIDSIINNTLATDLTYNQYLLQKQLQEGRKTNSNIYIKK